MNLGNISNKEKSNQAKSKAILEKLKSNVILKIIFNIMKKNISLDIAKYNKKLQGKLNLDINNYKEYYYQLHFSSIEIELKLENNKYDKFINIPYEEKEFYHIYFDYSKEEIKRI